MMLQSKLFMKKKSSSFTPPQESPNANPKLDISKVGKRAKEAIFGGHLGHLKQTHDLLVDSQSTQSTDKDELKSPYLSAVICKACHSSFARLRSDASPLLIIDNDVMLHQIALFENPTIKNVVVLSEVISRNMEVYYRIKALSTNATKNFFAFYGEHHRDAYVEEKVEENPNDRAIRVSAHWYQSHLAGSIQILLITNNRESKKNAIEESLSSETGFYPIREAYQMIEEFMLACNFSVAEKILKNFLIVFLVAVCHVSFVWNMIGSINRVVLLPLALIRSIELTGGPPPA